MVIEGRDSPEQEMQAGPRLLAQPAPSFLRFTWRSCAFPQQTRQLPFTAPRELRRDQADLPHGSQSPRRHWASGPPGTLKQEFNRLLNGHSPCHPSTFLENSTTANCIPRHTPGGRRETLMKPRERPHCYTPRHLPRPACPVCSQNANHKPSSFPAVNRQPRLHLSVSDSKNWV